MQSIKKPLVDEGVPEVMKVAELAAMLRLNPKTVYEALARGAIPGAVRVGGAYRISRAAVLKWMAEGQGRVLRRRKR